MNVPGEIIITILEHAYYNQGSVDQATLSSCSLLCHSWAVHAQRLLFRHVGIYCMYHGRGHISFLKATDPETERGRTLGGYVRIFEVIVGDKAGRDLDDADLAEILCHTPRLYELVLRVTGLHQFSTGTIEKLHRLASPSTSKVDASTGPLRIRALSLLSCGIQSPILYQLLTIWPSIEFLLIGVEIAAPPPKWLPECKIKLYQLTLMRTPRLPIISWMLSASMDTLRIISFRDAPGRELDPLLDELGPKLRSLRLMNYNLRAASVLKRCPNLEEFVLVQMSTLFGLSDLPKTLQHLSCRNLPTEPQSLGSVIDAVDTLPILNIVTCDARAQRDERFGELQRLCAKKGIELYLDCMPLWVRDDPVYVDRFPRRKTVANFALMN